MCRGTHILVLLPDDWLFDELLAKYCPLVSPLQALFHGHPARPDTEGCDHPPLVVEISHDHSEAFVFHAQEVLDRDFHIIELDVCRSCRGGIACLDLCRLDSLLSFDEEHSEASFRLDAGHEVVAKVAVGDPFLRS